MSQSFDPYQSPQYSGGQIPGGPPPRSGAVTVAAVLNFVFAAVQALCGISLVAIMNMEADLRELFKDQLKQQPGGPSPEEMLGFIRIVLGAFVVLAAIMFFLAVFSGIGLLKRRSWARVLTFILAGLSLVMALLAVVGVVAGDPTGLISVGIFGGYGIVEIILLASSSASEDFRRANVPLSAGQPRYGGQAAQFGGPDFYGPQDQR